MVIMNHYIGLNRNEFFTLALSCGIEALTGFEREDNGELRQEDYDRAIFSLYQRGFLLPDGDEEGFRLSPEIKQLFAILKNSRHMLSVECKREETAQYALYLFEKELAVMTPGGRKNEYVKLQSLPVQKLWDFVEDSGVLLPESLSEAASKYQELSLVEGEAAGFLETHQNDTDSIIKAFFEIQETMTKFLSVNSASGLAEQGLFLLEQPLQDKVVITAKEGTEIEPYAPQVVRQWLDKWVEEDAWYL